MNTTSTELLLNGQTVILNRTILKHFGITVSAVLGMLASEYELQKEHGNLIDEEWFSCTEKNLKNSLCLAPNEEKSATNKLIELGVIQKKNMGPSKSRHFKFDFENLNKLLTNSISKPVAKKKPLARNKKVARGNQIIEVHLDGNTFKIVRKPIQK